MKRIIIVSTINSQTIFINGIVSGKNGKPITAALVKLLGREISNTTDTNGPYTLSNTTSVLSYNFFQHVGKNVPGNCSPSYYGNYLIPGIIKQEQIFYSTLKLPKV